MKMPNDIKFNLSVNNIIKYKRGSTYYFLNKLTSSPLVYNTTNFTEESYPQLMFFQCKNNGKYEFTFKHGELFSDRFEIVDWNQIPIEERKEIIEYRNLEGEVDGDLKRTKLIYLFAYEIDAKVEEFAKAGNTYVAKTAITETDLSGYADICQENMLNFGDIIADGSSVMRFAEGYGIYSPEQTYEDVIEPIVISAKKRKSKILTLHVEKARILK